MQEPLEEIGPALVANAKTTAAEQPRERALDHPAVPTQACRGVDATTSDARDDAASVEVATQVGGVKGLVGVQFAGALARTPWPPAWADDRRNGINEREQPGRIVGVGSREPDGQRDAVSIHHQVILGPSLAAVGGVAASLLTPLFARTLTLSRLARFQSMAAASPNQLRSVSCSCCQTPASCRSRSRRQHVVPLPQPSSLGSSRQGQPVRKTKTMPPSAARSRTLGRPPFGLGGSFGNRGSMASQRSSGTRDDAFMVSDHAIAGRVLKHALSRGDEYGSGWIPSTPPRHSSLPWGNALPREPVVGISNGVGRPPAPPAAFPAAVSLLSRPVTVVVFPTHRPTAWSVHFRVVVAPHRVAALIPGPLPRG